MTTKRQRIYYDNALKIWDFLALSEVWKGSITDLLTEFSLSKGQFDKSWKFLKDSGCIEIVAFGNRFGQTEVRAVSRPTDEELGRFLLTTPHRPAKLEQMINDLAKLIGGVSLVELEARVTRLEEKLNEGDNTSGSHHAGQDSGTA